LLADIGQQVMTVSDCR